MVWPVPLQVGSSWPSSSILTSSPRCLWPNSFRKVQQFSWLCMVLPLSECGPYRRFSNSSSSWTLLTPFANLLSLAKSHSKGKTEHGDHPVVLWATSQTYIIPSLWLLLFALFWRARQDLTICENWPQESENGAVFGLLPFTLGVSGPRHWEVLFAIHCREKQFWLGERKVNLATAYGQKARPRGTRNSGFNNSHLILKFMT